MLENCPVLSCCEIKREIVMWKKIYKYNIKRYLDILNRVTQLYSNNSIPILFSFNHIASTEQKNLNNLITNNKFSGNRNCYANSLSKYIRATVVSL